MRSWRAIVLLLPLLLSCHGKESADDLPAAVQLSVASVSHTTVTLNLKHINADAVYVLCTPEGVVPSAAELLSSGIKAGSDELTLDGLEAGVTYNANAVAVNMAGICSQVQTASFTTEAVQDLLYPWELARAEIPWLADITLCTGGGVPNSNQWFQVPSKWNASRFAPHVSYKDGDGEHWLFDAFLAISGTDASGNNYGINNNGRKSADKASWEAFASYWLDAGGAFDELDKAVAAVVSRIGRPPCKRYVVMMMPDPVMLEYFSDKQSSRTYWGWLDGEQLDFNSIDDQVRACIWYIDLVREKFNALNPSYLQLAGVYILSEELVAKTDGYNYEYKRWDRILPKVGEYLNSCNESLFWIPYRKADGIDVWKQLGINTAFLQPNYYWDYSNSAPIKDALAMVKDYDMGMELEFEYSMVEEVMSTPGIMGPDAAGNYVFRKEDVPSLRGRFREYMQGFKDYNYYGERPIALYSGSNAMYQLASSSVQADKDMYLELCRFIADNPLKDNNK